MINQMRQNNQEKLKQIKAVAEQFSIAHHIPSVEIEHYNKTNKQGQTEPVLLSLQEAYTLELLPEFLNKITPLKKSEIIIDWFKFTNLRTRKITHENKILELTHSELACIQDLAIHGQHNSKRLQELFDLINYSEKDFDPINTTILTSIKLPKNFKIKDPQLIENILLKKEKPELLEFLLKNEIINHITPIKSVTENEERISVIQFLLKHVKLRTELQKSLQLCIKQKLKNNNNEQQK
jgi:hypothetical protein